MAVESENKKQGKEVIVGILNALKRGWLVIVGITVLFALAGLMYSRLQKPIHTATNEVIIRANAFNDKDGSIYLDTTLTKALLPTVVDFCSKKYVIDRACYYYKFFNDYLQDPTIPSSAENPKTFDKFYSEYLPSHNTYDRNTTSIPSNIAKNLASSNVTVVNTSTSTVNFYLSLKYKDTNEVEARKKVKMLYYALIDEGNFQKTNKLLDWKIVRRALDPERDPIFDPLTPEEEEYLNSLYSIYFGSVIIDFSDLSATPILSSTSGSTRIIILFTVGGLCLSLLLIYVFNLINRTITTKEEIESITGVDLLAYIADQDGGK